MMKADPPNPDDGGSGGEGGSGGGGPGGTSIFDVFNWLSWFANPASAVTGWVIGNAIYSHRKLTNPEWSIATGVFGNTLPSRDLITLTSLSGLGGRAFVLPGSMIATLTAHFPPLGIALASLASKIGMATLSAGYLVNMSAKYASDYTTASLARRRTLIHELTHVWQGAHGGYQWKYVFEAVMAQGQSGSAYEYTAGQPWGNYNPEQQGKIVEDWYAAGSAQSHANFPYIRDHIRKGKA